jgi:transposase
VASKPSAATGNPLTNPFRRAKGRRNNPPVLRSSDKLVGEGETETPFYCSRRIVDRCRTGGNRSSVPVPTLILSAGGVLVARTGSAPTLSFFVLRTGCQWEALDVTGLCPHSTAHNRFQEWVEGGLWQRLWQEAVNCYDGLKGLDWSFLYADGSMATPAKVTGQVRMHCSRIGPMSVLIQQRVEPSRRTRKPLGDRCVRCRYLADIPAFYSSSSALTTSMIHSDGIAVRL